MSTAGRGDGASGVGQVLGSIVAGIVFVAAFGVLLLGTQNLGGDRTPDDAAAHAADAESLARVLLDSPGTGWSGGADAVDRLGLGAANGTGLDLAHVALLRGAQEASAANGLVDYDEARASLGLTGAAGFHLRIYPLDLPAGEGADLSGIRAAYIGDWNSVASITVPLGTPTAMLASAQVQLDLAMASGTYRERDAMDDLGLDFDDQVHLTLTTPTILVSIPLAPDPPLLEYLGLTIVEGDVYFDKKQYIDAVLASRLSGYDLLVVGSNVDHEALTSAVTKNAIRDFVLGGGTLLVFGGTSQSFNWLNPLLDEAQDGINGAAYVPDSAHPILNEPWPLGWPSYNDFGQAWDFDADSEDDFEHVLVADDPDDGDVLAVSEDATFEGGSVLLTSFRLKDVSQASGATEARHLLENLLSYHARRELYLDYGPEVPADIAVATSVRHTEAWDPALGRVALRAELLAWATP